VTRPEHASHARHAGHRSPRALATAAVTALAVGGVTAALALGTVASTGLARGTAQAATAAVAAAASDDPATNVTNPAALAACAVHGAASAACLTASLAAVDAGRAHEHLPRLVLPTGFATWPADRQLLAVTNAERAVRGLRTVSGTDATLDAAARTAALANRDPSLPGWTLGGHPVAGWAANWAWGPGGVLLADFLWMYDDGLGSPNLDCTSAHRTGCWGHRHTILAFGPTADGRLLLGGAQVTTRWGAAAGSSDALLVAAVR